MKIKILLAGIVCLTLIACTPFSPENTTKLQIQGTVTDSSDDSPISQASVRFYHGGFDLFGGLPLQEIVESTNNQGNYFISCDLLEE